MPDIDLLVSSYRKLRDEKAAKKKDYEESIKPISEKMDRIESALLKYLNSTNQESAKTASGTAYLSERMSVSIQDRDEVVQRIKDGDLFHMLDLKLNVPAMREYIEQTGEPLPGTAISSILKVNVRKGA